MHTHVWLILAQRYGKGWLVLTVTVACTDPVCNWWHHSDQYGEIPLHTVNGGGAADEQAEHREGVCHCSSPWIQALSWWCHGLPWEIHAGVSVHYLSPGHCSWSLSLYVYKDSVRGGSNPIACWSWVAWLTVKAMCDDATLANCMLWSSPFQIKFE